MGKKVKEKEVPYGLLEGLDDEKIRELANLFRSFFRKLKTKSEKDNLKIKDKMGYEAYCYKERNKDTMEKGKIKAGRKKNGNLANNLSLDDLTEDQIKELGNAYAKKYNQAKKEDRVVLKTEDPNGYEAYSHLVRIRMRKNYSKKAENSNHIQSVSGSGNITELISSESKEHSFSDHKESRSEDKNAFEFFYEDSLSDFGRNSPRENKNINHYNLSTAKAEEDIEKFIN